MCETLCAKTSAGYNAQNTSADRKASQALQMHSKQIHAQNIGPEAGKAMHKIPAFDKDAPQDISASLSSLVSSGEWYVHGYKANSTNCKSADSDLMYQDEAN